MKDILTGWRVCIIASLFLFFQFLQLNLFSTLGDYFSSSFSLTPIQLGWLSSLYGFSLAFFLIPAGMILDRYPIKSVLLITIMVSNLSLLGLVQTSSLTLVVIARIIAGMTHAFAFLGSMRLVHQWLSQQAAFAVGVTAAICLSGGIVAQAPFHYLVRFTNPSFALYTLILLGSLVVLLMAFMVKENVKQPTRQITTLISMSKAFSYFFSHTMFMACGLYICFMNAPIMILGVVWGNSYLKAVTHFPLTYTSSIMMALFFGMIIGSLYLGKLTDRIGQYRLIMIISSLLCFASTLILNNFPHLHLFVATCLIFLIGFFSAAQTLGYPLIMHAAPSFASSQIMGITSVVVMGLGTCFQPLFGWLIQHPLFPIMMNSYQQAFYLIPFLLIISTFLVRWISFDI